MAVTRYLTAQKISLLVLPTSTARSRRPLEHHDASFSIQAFEEVLQSHASSMPGRTLLDVFLKHMWEVNSFDALHDLFDNLGALLSKSKEESEQEESQEQPQDQVFLSKTSPLGVFVRRARLEFMRLQFDDAMKLWTAFIVYRAPTAQWSKRMAGLASSGIDTNAVELGLQSGDELFEIAYGHLADEEDSEQVLSMDDYDRLLEFQLDQLQRLGCRVSDDMKAQLRTMLGPTGSVLRQSHLVRFFDAWKAGDYTLAFDNLHRYYDYAMQTREKTHYQFALLHMAILHADFGCFSESIAAINETIATARETQDMHCLNFSLSWLSHMSKAYPMQMKGAGYMGMLGSERDGLTFLKAKAKETRMYNLLSASLLNEAKLCMASGESIPRALEYMYQASHLNIKENISNHGSHTLLHSTLYSRLGIMHLTGVYSDLLLHCYESSCPVDERIRAICRTSFCCMNTGSYDEGIALLESIDSSVLRTIKFHQYTYFCIGLIKLKRSIRHTDWSACSSLLQSLNPDSSTDPECSFLLSEARIDYLSSRGLFSDAFNAIEDMASSLREEGTDILPRVTMLLMKANLFAKIGKPDRGFSVALRAASVAFKARLMPALWAAVGLLSNILNSLGEFSASSRLLSAIIPQTLEHGDQVLIGTLYSHLGDSHIGLAGLDNPSTSSGARARTTNMSNAELYFDRARECWKKAEDIEGECEQLMKRAIVAKARGDEKLAEEWSQNHNRVWEEGRRRIGEGEIVA